MAIIDHQAQKQVVGPLIFNFYHSRLAKRFLINAPCSADRQHEKHNRFPLPNIVMNRLDVRGPLGRRQALEFGQVCR